MRREVRERERGEERSGKEEEKRRKEEKKAEVLCVITQEVATNKSNVHKRKTTTQLII